MKNNVTTVAIVGAGLVGLGWAIVFARAGLNVRIFDTQAPVLAGVSSRLRTTLDDMKSAGLVQDVESIFSRISIHSSMKPAVSGAQYVQESVFERVEVKATIAVEIGKLLDDGAIVGSSSSGIPASAFTRNALNRDRFLIAHPVNPPHLIPLVELVPAPWTQQSIVPWLRRFMKSVGQVPIVVEREIEGFVLNRLQGALLNEAWALFEEGYATTGDIDLAVSHGLGLRWSFMGPFETIDLNAPGGVSDYAERLGPLYHSIAKSRIVPKKWDATLIAKVTNERRCVLPIERLSERSAWRDRRIMALARQRQSQTPE